MTRCRTDPCLRTGFCRQSSISASTRPLLACSSWFVQASRHIDRWCPLGSFNNSPRPRITLVRVCRDAHIKPAHASSTGSIMATLSANSAPNLPPPKTSSRHVCGFLRLRLRSTRVSSPLSLRRRLGGRLSPLSGVAPDAVLSAATKFIMKGNMVQKGGGGTCGNWFVTRKLLKISCCQ